MNESIEHNSNAPTDMTTISKKAYILMIITVAIIFIWGYIARLDSGAIAMGEVIPSNKVTTVQHKDGGIIAKINVKDGESVEKGATLLELDNVSEKSELEIVKIDKASLESLIERLEAERDGESSYASKVIDSKNTKVQHQLFISRKEGLTKDTEILNKRIKQIEDEIIGHRAEISSLQQILLSAKETYEINSKLYQDRFIDKRKLLESQNFMADVEGKIGKKYSDISKAKQKITETKVQINRVKNQWENDILEQLKQAKDALAVTNEKYTILLEKVKRSIITAPTSGTIHGMQFNTLGGVIRAGEDILQIVPQNQELIIEANLMPNDIDSVHVGLKAYVRILAYLQRTYNAVSGEVIKISPKTFKDDQTGGTYYKVQIVIKEEELKKAKEIKLQTGMLVQVEIVTGERTALEYILQPLLESFRRSFKEE